MTGRKHEFAVPIGDCARLSLFRDFESFLAEGGRERFPNGRVFTIQQRVARSDPDPAAEPSERLGQLHRYDGRANDGKARTLGTALAIGGALPPSLAKDASSGVPCKREPTRTPCAPKSPCGAKIAGKVKNPCTAAKNPYATKLHHPCSPKPQNPCGAKNPCSASPR